MRRPDTENWDVDVSVALSAVLRHRSDVVRRPDGLVPLAVAVAAVRRPIPIDVAVNVIWNSRNRGIPRFEVVEHRTYGTWVRARSNHTVKVVDAKMLKIPPACCLDQRPPADDGPSTSTSDAWGTGNGGGQHPDAACQHGGGGGATWGTGGHPGAQSTAGDGQDWKGGQHGGGGYWGSGGGAGSSAGWGPALQAANVGGAPDARTGDAWAHPGAPAGDWRCDRPAQGPPPQPVAACQHGGGGGATWGAGGHPGAQSTAGDGQGWKGGQHDGGGKDPGGWGCASGDLDSGSDGGGYWGSGGGAGSSAAWGPAFQAATVGGAPDARPLNSPMTSLREFYTAVQCNPNGRTVRYVDCSKKNGKYVSFVGLDILGDGLIIYVKGDEAPDEFAAWCSAAERAESTFRRLLKRLLSALASPYGAALASP